MAKSGCRPYWNRFEMENIPICSNVSMMKQYDDAITAVAWLYENELFEETKCLVPCSYTEYKVNFSKLKFNIVKLKLVSRVL